MSGLLESTVGAAPAVAWTPLADVSESEDAFHIEIELPGVKGRDIDVEANGPRLTSQSRDTSRSARRVEAPRAAAETRAPRFRHTYNHHRCHTALGGHPPISRVNSA